MVRISCSYSRFFPLLNLIKTILFKNSRDFFLSFYRESVHWRKLPDFSAFDHPVCFPLDSLQFAYIPHKVQWQNPDMIPWRLIDANYRIIINASLTHPRYDFLLQQNNCNSGITLHSYCFLKLKYTIKFWVVYWQISVRSCDKAHLHTHKRNSERLAEGDPILVPCQAATGLITWAISPSKARSLSKALSH